ncbi:MAG: hypothetical protein ABIY51_07135 [Ferruginibacter sp.]
MRRKKILILFPQQHISYSPTTLGMYDALSKFADITIYCPFPDEFKASNEEKRNFIFFKLDTSRKKKMAALPKFMYHKFNIIMHKHNPLDHLGIYNYTKFGAIQKAINKLNTHAYDEIICVDVLMLALAQHFCKQASFLSLELNEEERKMLQTIPSSFIKNVIIQDQQRYKYLFGDTKHKTFFVQNAPVFKKPFATKKLKDAFIFNGTATPWFGLYHCLNFIKQYPGFSMTFKGVVLPSEKPIIHSGYKKLVSDGNIIFNNNYTTNQDMLEFISQYEIGFCFYDLGYPKMNTFNYRTAPSGKMFAYFAAGVPVIGNKLDGLKPVEKFDAGILVDDFNPATILNAVNKIKSNYAYYQENCYKAATHYSFDRAIEPFVQELVND